VRLKKTYLGSSPKFDKKLKKNISRALFLKARRRGGWGGGEEPQQQTIGRKERDHTTDYQKKKGKTARKHIHDIG